MIFGNMGIIPSFVLLISFWSISVVGQNKDEWIDGRKFHEVIQQLARETSGTQYMQDNMDRYLFREEHLNGQTLLDQLEGKLTGQFENIYKAVVNLRDVVEHEYNNDAFIKGFSRDDPMQCCKTATDRLEESVDFKGAKVNIEANCVRYSEEASPDSIVPYSPRILEVMQQNRFDEKSVKWQYYGTEEGTFVKFPANRDTHECDYYDPRFRPWYHESAAHYPKDVVLVLDLSSSIGRDNLLPILIKAAQTAVRTTNPDDRIGVVRFSSFASSPPGIGVGKACYSHELAFATTESKDYLSSWIGNLTSGGDSNYMNALNKSFELLQSKPVTIDPRPRKRVILFLTDGAPSDADEDGILDLLKERNARLNNSVVLITYGIGKDLPELSKKLLLNMALQTKADSSFGPITNGTFIHVTSSDRLRSQLVSYFKVINVEKANTPIFTTPYADFSGLGLVSSVCLPVHPTGNGLRGVTCVDISLTELFGDAARISHNSKAYAFLSDYKGRTIMHPLMPDPLVYGQTVYLQISDLESDSEVKSVLASMKSGGSGNKTVRSTFIESRGNSATDGVDAQLLNAKYFWKPIGQSNLSFCVVVADSDQQISVQAKNLRSRNFVYHRLDFESDVEKCRFSDRLSTTANSVIKLTDIAFKDPGYYLYHEDTKERVQGYKAYMEDYDEYPHDYLKEVTKQMVAISEAIENIWKQPSKYDEYAVWRYYADYFGFIRIYPGLPLPRAYDHTKRGWFVKAVANSPSTVLTTPYIDAFGAGVVVTLTVPIFVGRGSGQHSTTDPLLGFVGMDFKLSFIESLIEKQFAACKDPDNVCFVVDESGYIVYHENIKYSEANDAQVENHHITELEPDIATYLIEHDNLVNKACVEFGHKKTLHMWRIEIAYNINNYYKVPSFDMHKVPNMNVFIGIKKDLPQSNICDCPDRSSKDYNFIQTCKYTDQRVCECPCQIQASYDACENSFKHKNDDHHICVPEMAVLTYNSPIPNEDKIISSLQRCKNINCMAYNKTFASDCKSIIGCDWCETGDICRDFCPIINSTTEEPPSVSPSEPPSPNLGLVIGCVVGVLVILIVVIVLIVLHKQKKLCVKKGRLPSDKTYIPDQPPSVRDSDIMDSNRRLPTLEPGVMYWSIDGQRQSDRVEFRHKEDTKNAMERNTETILKHITPNITSQDIDVRLEY